MQPWIIERQIRFQRDLDHDFTQEMRSTPGGEQFVHCIQCGTCSATCPLSIYMDYTPRRIVAMTRAGLKKDVLSSFTLWLCASCYACSVECPKDIKITDLMYALKRRSIEEKIYPKRFGIPVLAQVFFRLVRKNGRSNEGMAMVQLFLRTNPLSALKKARLGLNLISKGRLSIRGEAIRNRKGFKTLLDNVTDSSHGIKSEEAATA
ncbi:MAG: 4Fe-4S dicluster domain-containing protein [Fidelibacterota bacterium]|nr:MAG: 4Fe-4S dicluster domain-containing protein [Candidatus Neomarinimicrobiota bacterium]